MWGRTVLHEEDADLAKELEKVFSTKPCFGNISHPSYDATMLQSHATILEMPVRRIISNNCLLWSEEEYLAIEKGPAICQPCKSALSMIMTTHNSDLFVTQQKVTVEGDINFPSNDENDEEELSQLNNFLEGGHFADAQVKKEEEDPDERPLTTHGIKGGINLNEGAKKRYVLQGKDIIEYKCPLCNVSVATEREKYWTHLRSVHKQDSIECEVVSCHYTCVGTQQLMAIHMLDEHKKDPSKECKAAALEGDNHELIECTCDICGQNLTWSRLLLHYNRNHSLALHGCQFLCRYCGVAFNSRYLRTSHIEKEHAKASHVCDNCGKKFDLRSGLDGHRKKVHMKDSLKKQCQICKVWLCNSEIHAAHVRRHHTGAKPFKCTFCEKSFFIASDAWRHKKNVHPNSYAASQSRKAWLRENPGKDPSEYKMECHLCSTFRTTNMSDLRQHWNEIHPNLTDIHVRGRGRHSKICETCGDTLLNPTLLKIHTFEKHDIEETKCPLCPEQCQNREEAMKHMSEKHDMKKAPSKQKNAMCQHCGLVGTKGNINMHMRIHNESIIRPTSCTYCRKEFPNFHNMSKHRKIAHHKQWKVDKERLMAQEGSTYNKYKKQRGARKATCAICGTTLCSRQQLNLHMKARHGTGLPGYRGAALGALGVGDAHC